MECMYTFYTYIFPYYPPFIPPALTICHLTEIPYTIVIVCLCPKFLLLILPFEMLITSGLTLVMAEFLIYPHMLLISFSLQTVSIPGHPLCFLP